MGSGGLSEAVQYSISSIWKDMRLSILPVFITLMLINSNACQSLNVFLTRILKSSTSWYKAAANKAVFKSVFFFIHRTGVITPIIFL